MNNQEVIDALRQLGLIANEYSGLARFECIFVSRSDLQDDSGDIRVYRDAALIYKTGEGWAVRALGKGMTDVERSFATVDEAAAFIHEHFDARLRERNKKA